jgi:hypothetical protein
VGPTRRAMPPPWPLDLPRLISPSGTRPLVPLRIVGRRASGACHVAEITRTHGGRRYRSYLLRRTYRQDGQVKHETLGNLSRLPATTIELIRRAVRGDALVSPDDAFEIFRSRPHGHVAAVVGTARKLGLPALLAATRRRERDLVEALMAARLLDPCSKLATARALGAETEESSLGESLGVADADEDALYTAMDWLLARQGRVEQALARRHLTDGGLILYDVTSTYFEGRQCPLALKGAPVRGAVETHGTVLDTARAGHAPSRSSGSALPSSASPLWGERRKRSRSAHYVDPPEPSSRTRP